MWVRGQDKALLHNCQNFFIKELPDYSYGVCSYLAGTNHIVILGSYNKCDEAKMMLNLLENDIVNGDEHTVSYMLKREDLING